ncbi:MAG: hypothetical protein E7231_04860 [Cellulosilyticum sp.]|nr:hypothetical protein [Cellulosilyticum sp.]
MSQFNFVVSYLDSNGGKHDETVSLDSQDYKRHYEDNLSVLMQNYPPDQAETHILATKKHYIEETIANKFGGNTPLEYDMAEIINTLDRDVKGVL